MCNSSNIDNQINLYNNLTDINYERDDHNFLESIRYKLNNGNRILNTLIIFQERKIPFTIVKGFLFNEEKFSKFERCIIKVNEDIEIPKDIINGINIELIEKDLYQLTLT